MAAAVVPGELGQVILILLLVPQELELVEMLLTEQQVMVVPAGRHTGETEATRVVLEVGLGLLGLEDSSMELALR
jgi:hypothetical protein